jgi:hypothetical protein
MLDKWRAGKIDPRQDELIKWLMLLQAVEDESISSALEVLAMENAVLQNCKLILVLKCNRFSLYVS